MFDPQKEVFFVFNLICKSSVDYVGQFEFICPLRRPYLDMIRQLIELKNT